MLFGWLFGAGIMAGGHAQSEWRRADAKANKKQTYVDSCGIERYTDTKLPYDRTYENLRDNGTTVHLRTIENNNVIKYCQERIREEKENDQPMEWLIKSLENEIKKQIKKDEEYNSHMKSFNSDLDGLAKQRLRKQGYKF